MNFTAARAVTNHLIENMAQGVIDPEKLAQDLLGWFSEDDIKEFAEQNGYFDEDDFDEDEE